MILKDHKNCKKEINLIDRRIKKKTKDKRDAIDEY